MFPDKLFPTTHRQLDNEFGDAAVSINATLISKIMPQTAPDGGPMAIRIARVGNPNADRAFMVIGNTHGLEDIGTIVGINWMREQRANPMPELDKVCMFVVGLMSAQGCAERMRGNGIIDTNRHFLPLKGPNSFENLPENAGIYTKYPALMSPKGIIPSSLGARTVAASRAFVHQCWDTELIGKPVDEFQRDLARGIYRTAHSLFHGGTRPTWIYHAWGEALNETLGAGKFGKLAILDIHSGLGKYRELPRFSVSPFGDEAHAFAQQLFGPQTRIIGSPDASSPAVLGPVVSFWSKALPPEDVAQMLVAEVGLEVGTQPLRCIVDDLGEREILYTKYKDDHRRAVEIIARNHHNFTPIDPVWRYSAQAGVGTVLNEGIRRLAVT